MRLRPLASSAVLASAAVLGLLAGCAGGTPEPSAPEPAASAPSATGGPGSAAPTTSTAPSTASSQTPAASSKAPSSGGQEVTAADGALTWTMPCDNPVQEDVDGNEEDKKTYRSYEGWRCGERGSATSGAFVLELVNKPTDADSARQAMRTGLSQLAPNSKPKNNEVAGQPGITATAELNGKEFGFQVISFGSYLAVFLATPAEDLSTITSSIRVS